MTRTLSLILCFGCCLGGAWAAYEPPTWGDWPQWGDQGDGTYRNPVLPSDYSDIDCIRLGSDYYAISSTFQYSPGMVILHSKDLVNWTILGHVITDVTQMGPEFNWDRMNRYGKGVWAGAIRYHDHRFWVYFGTPNEGYFMSTAAHPAGPWTPLLSFSLDGQSYTELGEQYQLSWGHYRGDRIGLYCYNNTAEAGYVDVDYLYYTVK